MAKKVIIVRLSSYYSVIVHIWKRVSRNSTENLMLLSVVIKIIFSFCGTQVHDDFLHLWINYEIDFPDGIWILQFNKYIQRKWWVFYKVLLIVIHLFCFELLVFRVLFSNY